MKRLHIIICSGLVLLVCSFFFLPQAIDFWVFKNNYQRFDRLFLQFPRDRMTAFAPVILWDDKVPDGLGSWKNEKSISIELSRGVVLISGSEIDTKDLRNYLDRRILRDPFKFLIVEPSRDTSWRDLWKVLDECRQSKIELVLLRYD
jgi:hypothetical protein